MNGAVFADAEVLVAGKVKRKSGNGEKKKKRKKKHKAKDKPITDSLFLTGVDINNNEVIEVDKLPPPPVEDENVLKYPDELIDLRKNLKTPPQTKTQLRISKSLEGLPGRLELNPVITKKYFGQKARTHFFDRYKWIDQQMQITQLDKSQETNEFFFNGEEETVAQDNTYAFAPQRPELSAIAKQLEFNSNGNNEEEEEEEEDDDDIFDSEQLLKDTISVYSNLSLAGKLTMPSEIELGRVATAGGSIRHHSITSSVSSLQESEVDELDFLDSLGILPMGGCLGNSSSHRNKYARNSNKKLTRLPSMLDSGIKSSLQSDVNNLGSVSIASKHSDYSNGSLRSNNPSNDFLLNTMAIPNSPRTTYLVGCAKLNILPRPSLILRKNLTKELDLQHQGMGDQMATVLAESMKELPYIQSINLKDNNLSCTGLVPIFNVIAHIPNLLSLDVGYNNLGNICCEVELFVVNNKMVIRA